MDEVHDHLADEVKALRIEVTQLQETIAELRSVIRSERAKVIDLPNPRAPHSRFEEDVRYAPDSGAKADIAGLPRWARCSHAKTRQELFVTIVLFGTVSLVVR
jgi:hypothetical protein